MITYRTLFSLATLVFPLLAPRPEEPTLEQRLERLSRTLEQARQEAHVPGLSVAIVKDDEIVFAQGFGLADLASGRAAKAETLYPVGSTTKAFTATLIGMLVDEGRADWDDPVTKYLPYFDLDVRSEDEQAACTLRDLLSHRHGFARMSLLWFSDGVSRREILETAAGAEPFDDFRAGFHYCNVTYLAAGEAAAVAGEGSWEELMEERLLTPLRMESSSLSVAGLREDPRLATGYEWNDAGARHRALALLSIDRIGPAGSLNSNVLDMAQWLRLQLGEGEVDELRLIGAERLRETWKPQVTIGNGASYGLGWMLQEWQGHKVVEHGGNIGGFSAQVGMIPSERLGFVLLSNLENSPLQQAALPLVFEALLGDWPAEAEARVGALDYDPYEGVYLANFANFRDEEFEVFAREGGLALDIPSQQVFDLKDPDDEGKWSFALTDQIAVSFERDDEGRVVGLVLHQSGFRFEVPREDVEVPAELGPKALERHVGPYVHASGKRIEIVAAPGGIAFQNGNELLPLAAPDAEGLAPVRARPEFVLAFAYDAGGAAVGLEFWRPGRAPETFVREGAAPTGDLPTLEEVLALGGRLERDAALREDHGLRISGKVRVPQAGLSGTVTEGCEGEGRSFLRLDFGKFGHVHRVTRDGEVRTNNTLQGFEEPLGGERTQALLEHPLAIHGDWRRHYDRVVVQREDRLEERIAYVLRLTKEGLPDRRLWIDAVTGDALRLDYTALEGRLKVPITLLYSNYDEWEGLRWPRRLVSENPGSGRLVLDFERLERGLVLGESAFRLAPDAPGR